MRERDDDATLQDLIVRALTGGDTAAQRALSTAAHSDPELQAFCGELEDIVALLAGAKTWRAISPSSELAEKIRQAVAAKLASAPPQFRRVVLEADLGARRANRRLALVVCVVLLGIAGFGWQVLLQREGGAPVALKGVPSAEILPPSGPLTQWALIRETEWRCENGGLHSAGSEDAGAAVLKQGVESGRALAFEVDVRPASGLEQAEAAVFIAEAEPGGLPAFGASALPGGALVLEISADGLVLNGPDRVLLQARSLAEALGQAAPSASTVLSVRIEYLVTHARVLVNGRALFSGRLQRPLRGSAHPGVRAAGLRKNEVLFNAPRIER